MSYEITQISSVTVTLLDQVDAFLSAIECGHIDPNNMASVLHAMHAAMVDRHSAVALWMPIDLEQMADIVDKAIECAERQDEDYPKTN